MRHGVGFWFIMGSVLGAAPAALADHEPRSWTLAEIAHGEALRTVHPGVTVDRVEVTETTGDVFVTACCGPEDCSASNSYRLGWVTAEPYDTVARGQTISLSVTAQLTRNGGCMDVDPYILACGQDGCISPLVTERGIPIVGPNPLTDGGDGTTYVDPTTVTHTPSARVIQVYDRGNMPHDGYFRVAIEQRWGLDYEFAWIFRAPAAAPDAGSADVDAGSAAGTDAGAAGADAGGTPSSSGSCRAAPGRSASGAFVALALLALAGARRARRRRVSRRAGSGCA